MLVRKGDLRLYKDCKVFSGEVCFSQHRLLVLDIHIKRRPRSTERAVKPRILWKNLYGEAAEDFRARVIEGVTSEEENRLVDAEQMCNKLANMIREAAKETLGVGEDEANRSAVEERYKEAKREAKKALKPETEGKRDLGIVRFIKDEDGGSIVNEDAFRRRWKEYLSVLFNGQRSDRTKEVDSIGVIPQNNCYFSRIRHTEVKEALRKMGRNKVVGSDEIPIEAWRNPEGLNERLEQWRKALEDNGLQVSREKIKYLRCNFSRNENDRNEEEEIRIGEHILEPKESFRYLGSMIHKSRRIEDDVTHRIQVGWLKWRAATRILYDKKVPLKLKGKFYRVAIQPAMLYGSECWSLTKVQANRMEVAKMRMEVIEIRMLRRTCSKTILDMIPNGVF
ncbi:hypothetical protein Tco_1240988 [Tanacetum coccineum]